MNRFLLAIALIIGSCIGANAQSCNPPSGWLQQVGQIQLGDIILYGPNCGQVSDGGAPSASPTLPFVSLTAFGAIGDGAFHPINITAMNSALVSGKCVYIPWTAAGYNFGNATFNLGNGACVLGENQVLLLGLQTLFRITGSQTISNPVIIDNLHIDLQSVGGSAILFGTVTNIVQGVQISRILCTHNFSCIQDEVTASNYVADIKIYDVRSILTRGTTMTISRSRGFIWVDTFRVDQTANTFAPSWVDVSFSDFIGLEINRFDSLGGSPTPTIFNGGHTALAINGAAGGAASVWLNRILVDNSNGNGININTVTFLNANWIEGFQNLGYQIQLTNISFATLSNITARGAVGSAGAQANQDGLSCTGCTNTSFSNVVSAVNSGNGIHITNSTGLTFFGINSTSNTLWGLIEDGSSNGNIFDAGIYATNGSGCVSLIGAQSIASNLACGGTFQAYQMPAGGNTFGLMNTNSLGIGNFTNAPTLSLNQNGTTQISIANANTGSSANTALSISNGTSNSLFGNAGINYNLVAVLQGRLFMDASPTSNGLVLNTEGAKSIDFAVSSVLAGQFSTDGDWHTINGQFDTSYTFNIPVTAFAITLGNHVYTLLLDPAGTLATGAITMPPTPHDGQIIRLKSSQAITALTITPNSGQSVKGSPGTIPLGGLIDCQFRAGNTTWYC